MINPVTTVIQVNLEMTLEVALREDKVSKVLIEDVFHDSEGAEEITFPATDKDLLVLTEKFLKFEISPKIFLQAIAIADYDCAAAFRYVDNYLTIPKKKNKRKHKNLLLFRSSPNFENN